ERRLSRSDSGPHLGPDSGPQSGPDSGPDDLPDLSPARSTQREPERTAAGPVRRQPVDPGHRPTGTRRPWTEPWTEPWTRPEPQRPSSAAQSPPSLGSGRRGKPGALRPDLLKQPWETRAQIPAK